ncbi:Cyclic peptide transporter [Hyella patelloides LEGE 07179]|uniref:Cyclic peptide transporter n=1 Tax=Hyella patelloides LEGE 07179 TaxID=945734 RepID=A0A563VM77_9CYAN|nr:cyclic peptide export ABC transporter [Hyella patelloides]VEP12518.1 Cyclic peptide transporter [Hyella patelloides LEGE 07179]
MEIIRLLLQNSRKNLFIAVISSFISGASSAGVIALINYAIANLADLPAWLLWSFIGLCLILWIFRFISWVLITRLSQEMIYNLRLEMTQRILNCPLQHLETIGAPKLLATLTGDINAIASASIQISLVIVNCAVLLGIFAYLCWLSPLLFAIVFNSIVMGFTLYTFLQEKGIKEFEKVRKVQDILFGHFRSVTEGTKELKLHRLRRIAFIEEELKLSATQARHYFVKGVTAFAFAGSLGTILFFVPIGLILFVLPKLTTVSTALLSSYALAVLYIINPISEIASSLPQIAQANVSLNKIETLGLSLTAPVTETALTVGQDQFYSDWANIELVDINHAYHGDNDEHQFTLDKINLKFQPGEITFIVGGNGSGKSTLVKLITGLYIPDCGKILFDRVSVTDDNRELYRQHFSVVFSDFYLFDRLIGIDASQQSEIHQYLSQLEIDHKVTITNGILSTTNLSQGQRKRLALLTAYLEDRPIYVFDEWASDQDPVFKEVFYKKLLPELKNRGKTVIAVSHDDFYFSECDRLIKLDYGRVVTTK